MTLSSVMLISLVFYFDILFLVHPLVLQFAIHVNIEKITSLSEHSYPHLEDIDLDLGGINK